jgi:hypothetical protein
MLRKYYTDRTGFRRKYAKLSIGADVLQQIICKIRIRRAPTRHDNIECNWSVRNMAQYQEASYVIELE